MSRLELYRIFRQMEKGRVVYAILAKKALKRDIKGQICIETGEPMGLEGVSWIMVNLGEDKTIEALGVK